YIDAAPSMSGRAPLRRPRQPQVTGRLYPVTNNRATPPPTKDSRAPATSRPTLVATSSTHSSGEGKVAPSPSRRRLGPRRDARPHLAGGGPPAAGQPAPPFWQNPSGQGACAVGRRSGTPAPLPNSRRSPL